MISAKEHEHKLSPQSFPSSPKHGSRQCGKTLQQVNHLSARLRKICTIINDGGNRHPHTICTSQFPRSTRTICLRRCGNLVQILWGSAEQLGMALVRFFQPFAQQTRPAPVQKGGEKEYSQCLVGVWSYRLCSLPPQLTRLLDCWIANADKRASSRRFTRRLETALSK